MVIIHKFGYAADIGAFPLKPSPNFGSQLCSNIIGEKTDGVQIRRTNKNRSKSSDLAAQHSTFTSTGKRNCMVRDTGFEPVTPAV